MADVLALVGNAIDTLKKLKEIADKIKDAETRNLIGDLSLALADVKIQAAELKEENLRLQRELQQERERKTQAEQLVVKDGVLFFQVAPTGKPAGPYCPNCKESDNRLVLMQDNRGTHFEQLFKFYCNACKSKFN